MNNIIKIINEIGSEIDATLKEEKSSDYFKQIITLYSLIENLLKYLVATKECWDESCKQAEIEIGGGKYEVNFEVIRKKTVKRSFSQTIQVAHKQEIISSDLQTKLNNIRKNRNDFIHQFWILKYRNNSTEMKPELIHIESVTVELIKVFNWLVFEEIGVIEDEVLEIL